MIKLHSSIVLYFLSVCIASAEVQGVFQIETRILSFDPQSGMKSTQTISVDLDTATKSINFLHSYKTGTTNVGGTNVGSVRDKFEITDKSYDLGTKQISFRATGQTASGILVMPDIDYDLSISFSGADGKNLWVINGCHDGYPAYKVSFKNTISGESKTLYHFKHQSVDLAKLLGSCDIKVDVRISEDD